MVPLKLVAIAALLLIALFGFRGLHLFARSNGLLAHLERVIGQGVTPRGRQLRTITTNGRIPSLDLQLKAVAAFLLLFCEDGENLDAAAVGFSFAASWGASWSLVVLESRRSYSQHRFMSWITIPGIFIFNQSNAIFTPLYLALRLAVARPSVTPESLRVQAPDLVAMPWSFLLGYTLPLFLMALPGMSLRASNTKHVLASWYQQWNLYISLVHVVLTRWWDSDDLAPISSPEDLLARSRPVYMFTLALAAASVWVPFIVSCLAALAPGWLGPRRARQLTLRSVFVPPSPWSPVRCRDAFEGGKWLLQWDGIIGGMGSAVWAAFLYADTIASRGAHEPVMAILMKVFAYMLLGGPMGVATGLLWERDELVLRAL